MYAFICCKYYINSIYNIKIHKLHFYKLCFELYEKIVFFSFLSIRLIIKLKKNLVIRLRKVKKLDLTSQHQHPDFTPYSSTVQPYTTPGY